MKTKLTAFILLAAMLAMTASCGDSTDAPVSGEATSADTDGETTAPAAALPDADFEGYEFTFLNGNVFSWFTVSSVTTDEQNGETMNDAIYERNRKVEERYNITLSEIPSSNAQADYLKSVQVGDDAFDVALLRMEWALPVVLQNAAVNWNNIPYLELDREWWVQGS
ncbi:MAG: hypothetical protein ACI4T6_05505, partial [Candidatus Flemingiibacterium sp.]